MITYLAHHGVAGQKWGVRNAEWYPIDAWKKARKNYVKAERKQRSHIEKAVVKRNGNEYLKKGTKFYRITNASEKVDNRRKYVTTLQRDRKTYRKELEFLPVKRSASDKIVEMQMVAVKDLKVETDPQKIIDFIHDRSNDEFKKNIEIMNEVEWTVPKVDSKMNAVTKKKVEQLNELWVNTNFYINGFYYERFDELKDHYVKKGYDAIVDVFDYGYTDLPLVLLDPSKSVKLQKYNKV